MTSMNPLPLRRTQSAPSATSSDKLADWTDMSPQERTAFLRVWARIQDLVKNKPSGHHCVQCGGTRGEASCLSHSCDGTFYTCRTCRMFGGFGCCCNER